MTNFFHWWAQNRSLVLLLLAVLGFYANYEHYKAIKSGKCERGDLGYFWRLWRAGDPAGRRVMLTSFLAIALGVIYLISIFMVV